MGLTAGLFAALVAPGTGVQGQTPPFSTTLRYGSGYLDVPVALVLPSLAFRASMSVFRVDVEGDPEVDASGTVVGPGEPRAGTHGDASFALGLWDRVELGTSLQSLVRTSGGGRQVGIFGKLLLLDPTRSGFGVAAGVRYVGPPDFEDGVKRAPARLGFGDRRLRADPPGGSPVDTRWTLYGVASTHLPGPTFPWLPDNRVSLSVGYGTGMFAEGGDLEWYGREGTGGWFFGGGWEVRLGAAAVASLKAEHNGFDVNAGAEVAWRGLRIGVHGLGLNHGDGSSVYRSRKWGASVSLTACPILRRACRPGLRAGVPADTVRLPAPPPDTVVLRIPAEGPAGTPVRLCLATGEDLWVRVTAAGDTVASGGAPGAGRPALPGRYARGTDWYAPGAPLALPAGTYHPEGDPDTPACAVLEPWGEHRGVPLFRLREASDPPAVLLLPLAPGTWQRYRRAPTTPPPSGPPSTARIRPAPSPAPG